MIGLSRILPLTIAAALFMVAPMARAVTFISTADPTFNTTPPTGALAGSGWQYEASFGPFLATAVGPHHFLTVKHIGIPSNVFVYQGAAYTIISYYDDPGGDLRMFVVAETVPSYAPVYSGSSELGRDIVVIGRGTQRGNPVYVGSTLLGWEWGSGDTVQRWGENQISQAYIFTLYATFDRNGKPNEAHLSSGDSGGAVFMNDGGVWKLAGLNSGVDGPFANVSGAPTFNATLFDVRGLFSSSLGRVVSGTTSVPSGFYAVRVSAHLPWIQSILYPGLPTPTPTPIPTPSIGPARMLSPVPGSTFTSSGATFNWSAGSATNYWLFAGNSSGASDIYNSGNLSVRSITVNNFPTNGATVYVRLCSRIGGRWQSIDYTYKSYGYTPTSTPAPTPTPTPPPTPTPASTPTRSPTPPPRRIPPLSFERYY